VSGMVMCPPVCTLVLLGSAARFESQLILSMGVRVISQDLKISLGRRCMRWSVRQGVRPGCILLCMGRLAASHGRGVRLGSMEDTCA
jgi:hypothetical protein